MSNNDIGNAWNCIWGVAHSSPVPQHQDKVIAYLNQKQPVAIDLTVSFSEINVSIT